ncbi:MAG TPA: hypothetical protein VGK06_16355 [Methanosarcina sp.]|jgi:hypothetical protein
MSDKQKENSKSEGSSVWGVKEFLQYTLTIIIIMSVSYFIIEDVIKKSETIFAASVSEEPKFEVYLTNDTKYELWVVDFNGPEKIDISIRKDSYTGFEDTFMLMYPEGDYLPYHPTFTVKENGTYQMHAKPLDSGNVRIGIRKIHGFSMSFI